MGFVDDLALYTVGYMAHESHPMRLDAYCLNTIQRKSPCYACSDACPQGISIHEKKIRWTGCTNCNMCIPACPTEALHESSSSFKQFEAMLVSPDDYVEIGCGKYSGRVDARVACLAALPWELVAALSLRKRVVLKVGPCKECEDRDLYDKVDELFKRLRYFFGKEEFKRRIYPRVPEGAMKSEGYTKRTAMTSAASMVKGGAEKLVSEKTPNVSHYRALLLDALESIPEQERPEVHWRTLVEDGSCRGCEICSKLCPHDAIKLRIPGYKDDADDEDRFAGARALDLAPDEQAYIHEASRCTQCGLCYMTCPHQNIGGWDKLTTTEVPAYESHPLNVLLCEKCGRPYMPENEGDTKCKACSRHRFGKRK